MTESSSRPLADATIVSVCSFHALNVEGSGNAGRTILSASLAFDRYFRSEACEGGGGGGSPAGGGVRPAATELSLLSSLELEQAVSATAQTEAQLPTLQASVTQALNALAVLIAAGQAFRAWLDAHKNNR